MYLWGGRARAAAAAKKEGAGSIAAYYSPPYIFQNLILGSLSQAKNS